ncbi:MAG TPA: pyrroline-5-carboxylate reductase [Acidimicrobiales bacterium]|nr:pyrroline-5-carboxylate reductase [Acidimicrobiales bacterium]
MQPEVVVIGGGRMGAALVRGMLGAGRSPETLCVVEASPERRRQLADDLPGVTVRAEAVGGAGAVVAVKPADAATACGALATTATPRVLSIMAGVPLARLEQWLPPETAVVRAMPNTPATVGAGVAAVAGGSRAGDEDLAWARGLLETTGLVVTLPETALDAVTGLSGSGPAYVFLLAEALVEAGVGVGLAPEVSRLLAVGTVVGAGRLLEATGAAPEELRAQVTSPGGTTEAGLRVLEGRGQRDAVAAAVAAATERSRELGGPPDPG